MTERQCDNALEAIEWNSDEEMCIPLSVDKTFMGNILWTYVFFGKCSHGNGRGGNIEFY